MVDGGVVCTVVAGGTVCGAEDDSGAESFKWKEVMPFDDLQQDCLHYYIESSRAIFFG